eukprot:TRINITY_DN8395_c0_g1_i1.p1 TRINITY_DN8395_c0_g1~~TRINITY_DN8395_c0_g1_i1.p1  ORF type:complete len:279 (-),score=72.66 TRINITY_DN8395_c0_g1_i1:197-1033(-)
MFCVVGRQTLSLRNGDTGFKRSFASKTGRGVISNAHINSVKGATPSSTEWLRRQLKDPYVRMAKEDGYNSRAAYKLAEMDDRNFIIYPGAVVVDLGCAPGGWTQVAVERTNAMGTQVNKKGNARLPGVVIGVDLTEMSELPGSHFIQGDFTEAKTQNQIRELLQGRKVSIVLSDMAPNSCGQNGVDHDRLMILVKEAYGFAMEVLKTGGHILFKVSRGGQEEIFKKKLKEKFTEVKFVKPPSSRDDSREIYILAKGLIRDKEETKTKTDEKTDDKKDE